MFQTHMHTPGAAENRTACCTYRPDAQLLPLHQEIAFATLEDDMRCAEDYVRYACRWLLQHCRCLSDPASCADFQC